ncbi:hypothetical protein [Bradyrhizobium sp. 144]|uniref:hypothetical protein n=2 Tax=Nitrobacteraceae TaxID=41294 RepID=UPI001FFC0B08|nr:hypothetical protein [Bradyrhizobium sp. 144]MCK1693595.1 hypothetical protein [Bradyrhizobium sp. 144]
MPPDIMRPEIIVPFVMYCALLWWVGRGLSWTARLATAAVTLVLIFCVLLFERGWPKQKNAKTTPCIVAAPLPAARGKMPIHRARNGL